MNFLRFLEGIRTPFFDNFFSLVTHLGEETVFLIVALALIWCVNKRYGFFILYCGLFGQAVSQFMKLGFKVERPWVAHPDFTPVKSAIEEAKGFSFPSGHTQIATTTYGGLALLYRRKRILSFSFLLILFLIAFSRMYLGVHYPFDVIASLLINTAIVFTLFLLGKRFSANVFSNILKLVAILLITALFAYSYVVSKNNLYNPFMQDSIDFASKLLGATLGFFLSWYIDDKYINFDTRAPFLMQAFKIVLGAAALIGIKGGLKMFFAFMGLAAPFSHIFRYFIIVVFAGIIWPLCFTKINKLLKE